MSGLRLAHDTWVLVGDGEKALLFRNEGDAAYPNLVVENVFAQDNPPNREQATDVPGRMNRGRPSNNKSAIEPTDWHRLAKDRFASEVAETLYRAAHEKRFERLVVVAPPQTLGELRKAFHKEVSERIVAEVDKTLTSHPVYDIEKVLTA
ncbi:Protein required for attachment to host cells [Chelatococcus sambhunathii]|uniref:Protein required for attachment to host cells n=1 Tax=Chelatococcus sambhunathii TaxID=363953 RepID=A0ABM9U877_9HYPH|nr:MULTISPECIES: host attachment family protein [Chelatococcus]CUA88959.1 Protein required for attachment to host cells [Chelatococcus sambhunathii]